MGIICPQKQAHSIQKEKSTIDIKSLRQMNSICVSKFKLGFRHVSSAEWLPHQLLERVRTKRCFDLSDSGTKRLRHSAKQSNKCTTFESQEPRRTIPAKSSAGILVLGSRILLLQEANSLVTVPLQNLLRYWFRPNGFRQKSTLGWKLTPPPEFPCDPG